ncbi:acetate--CoA ligase [Candidatus Pacearchaeota archaeon]|jgi:acetyl-CoA synthetase|nr:acetate--CoA ligase [Candidatus Pacearchaeota archaeon]|tara:strand:- start:3406 stop:5322 length:1917 start_codon:yes stop_codon:yes gene_type:complete
MKKYIIKKGDKYWPSNEIKKIAWIKDNKIYKQADKNPVKFWDKLAKEGLIWEKSWKKTYIEKLPYFWWFKGGKLNFCINALDRHLKDKGDKTALIWVPEPTSEKTVKLTYNELSKKVNKFANVLEKLGVKKGDVVAIYLPMIPEVLIAILACTRIGAIHSVVFSAFSADALKTRLQDGKAKILISADGYYRRGEKEYLDKKVNKAIIGTKVRKVIIVNRLSKNKKYSRKFISFEKEIEKADSYYKPRMMNSEDPLFILYTSGTTGKPKGVVHDIGGYATYAYWTTKWNFNLHNDDVMWCTADVGWITGHTYAFYGPLLNGGTTVIYEGTPDYPNYNRWWNIIDKNKITVFYTAPTAIRMFMKAGEKFLKKHKLNTLRIIGTVGEPIDKDTWEWYFKKVGKSRCPIIDTWWQTETGGSLINSLPGVGPFIPTISGYSFPGTKHIVVNEKGKKVKDGKIGSLVQLSPFAPGMLHGIYKNPKKYKDTYFKRFRNKYDTSDGAYIKNKLIRITGRTDDVIKVAGHRLSTAELENAINKYSNINESAVVSIPDKIKGEVPVSFVVLKSGNSTLSLEKQLKKHIDKTIGPIARPSKIYFVKELPKTRSGKIMRRILKNILNKEKPEGLMTLVNPDSVKEIEKII